MLIIYESNYEVDDIKGVLDGEDKKMDDGELIFKFKFCEINYFVEMDEIEMISMNYIVGSGGNVIVSVIKGEKFGVLFVEFNGKGKRKLGEDEEGFEVGCIVIEDIFFF